MPINQYFTTKKPESVIMGDLIIIHASGLSEKQLKKVALNAIDYAGTLLSPSETESKAKDASHA